MTAVFVVAAASLAAQTYDFSGAAKTIPFRVLSGEPGVCSPGEAYYNLTTTHLRYCGIVNTWADMAASSGAVTSSTLTANTVAKASGASALADSMLFDIGGTRVGLGGTTASFPAIKRNAAAINFRLADDSGDANITAATVTGSDIASTADVHEGATGAFYWSGRAVLKSPTNTSIELLDNPQTGFGVLQFGGTTSSYPALKRSGNALAIRQADDTVATFSTLTACASGLEGSLAPVSDSTTATWGATITGSGANHVLAYCDGTNWTVAAK